MDEISLKPCPFCGGRVDYNFDISMEPVGVMCAKCHAITRYTGIRIKGNREPFGVAMKKIAEAWNRRAEPVTSPLLTEKWKRQHMRGEQDE